MVCLSSGKSILKIIALRCISPAASGRSFPLRAMHTLNPDVANLLPQGELLAFAEGGV